MSDNAKLILLTVGIVVSPFLVYLYFRLAASAVFRAKKEVDDETKPKGAR